MALVIKIHLNDETRRVTLEKIPTYSEILETIREMFPTLEKFTLKYQDDDSDLITISSEKELVEALNVVAKTKLLRLTIYPANSTSSSSTSSSNSNASSSNSSSNAQSSSQPNFNNMNNPLAAFLSNPQLLSQFLPQQPQQQSQSNPNPFVPTSPVDSPMNNNNAPSFEGSQGMPPFLQQMLQNPMMLQMIPQLLPTFLPMITNALQNATPQQKEKVKEFLSNPQLAAVAPQLLAQLGPILSSTQPSPQQPDNFASPELDVNFGSKGFSCDVCENSITGVRYHCSTCTNYDLCSFCQSIPDIHIASHNLTEVHPGELL